MSNAMVTPKAEEQILSKDEERRFGKSLQKALLSNYPNPSREGCPNPKILRDIAFHKRMTPNAFEQVTLHIAECSACVRDALGYAEEYRESRRRSRRIQLVLAVAAAVVFIAVGLWTMWRQPKQEIAGAPPQIPAAPLVATVRIELPSRWRGSSSLEQRPIVLNRTRMQLEIYLPIGSSEGAYRFRILDKSGSVKKTIEATARTENGTTSLKSTLDLSDLSAGDYLLSVLEPRVDEWAEYPINVK
jgi:hypothetical protein